MGLLDYLREQLNPPSSVMDRKYVDRSTWQPEYENEPALQPPMISPDDLIGTGIPNKLAGLLAAGGKGLLATPMVAGTFIGKNAKTWNAEAAKKAEGLLSSGADPRKVWNELGVFRGPDGHLRQEISDHAAEFTPVPAFFTNETGVRQGNVLKHPDLYSTDYGLENVMVKRGNEQGGSFLGTKINGEFAPHASEIEIGTSGVKKTPLGFMVNPDQAKSINTHELQHAIQKAEGWESGGSIPMSYEISKLMRWYPEQKKTIEDVYNSAAHSTQLGMNGPYNVYKHFAGEAEARATQARMNMDMAQRRATYPLDSYDVPINQLIIRGLLGD